MKELIDYIKGEWGVLSKAPFSFATLLVLSLIAGAGVCGWRDSGQIDALKAQLQGANEHNTRLSIALGVQHPSAGALVELSNQELALATQSIVVKLRQLGSDLDAKLVGINRRKASGEIDDTGAAKEKAAAIQEMSREFDSDLASDAFNIENELRTRLSPTALSHVPMVPAFIGDNDPRTRLTFLEMMRGLSFSGLMVGRFADEMEEMAKLLPPDSKKP